MYPNLQVAINAYTSSDKKIEVVLANSNNAIKGKATVPTGKYSVVNFPNVGLGSYYVFLKNPSSKNYTIAGNATVTAYR